MVTEALVIELLLRWEDIPSLTPQELCREYRGHPEYPALLEAVQRAIRDVQAAASLIDTPDNAQSDSSKVQDPVAVPTWKAPALRYRPLAFHARGGLGEVFRCASGGSRH